MKPFRIDPTLPASAFQTYSIVQPRDRTVVTACEHAGCEAWARGWDTAVDETTDLGKSQAAWIRTRAKRTFKELKRADGLTVFRFDSRQRCFAEHRTRPEIFAVRNGDWRANLGGGRIHTRPDDWVEDFAEQLDTVRDQQQAG